MRLHTGNMWESFDSADLILITTNSTLKSDGRLVMGAGIAKQALARFPNLDIALGKAVQHSGERYGLLVSDNWPRKKLGAFQTKYHWRDQSTIELIAHSSALLTTWANTHPSSQIHLNYPGVGLGGLSIQDVHTVIRSLPDNVNIWRLK